MIIKHNQPQTGSTTITSSNNPQWSTDVYLVDRRTDPRCMAWQIQTGDTRLTLSEAQTLINHLQAAIAIAQGTDTQTELISATIPIGIHRGEWFSPKFGDSTTWFKHYATGADAAYWNGDRWMYVPDECFYMPDLRSIVLAMIAEGWTFDTTEGEQEVTRRLSLSRTPPHQPPDSA